MSSKLFLKLAWLLSFFLSFFLFVFFSFFRTKTSLQYNYRRYQEKNMDPTMVRASLYCRALIDKCWSLCFWNLSFLLLLLLLFSSLARLHCSRIDDARRELRLVQVLWNIVERSLIKSRSYFCHCFSFAGLCSSRIEEIRTCRLIQETPSLVFG